MIHLDVESYFLIEQQQVLKEIRSEKCLFNSLDAAQGWSVGSLIKQSWTPPPALPKALVHISCPLCKQNVFNLSSHSKKFFFFAPIKDRYACENLVKFSLIIRGSQLSPHMPGGPCDLVIPQIPEILQILVF